MKGKGVTILVGTIVFLILGSLLITISPISEQIKLGNEYENALRSYTPHDVIRINSNADFATQAANEGWPGDGSAGNPYIISAYEINAYNKTNGIYIGNTTVHFIIENCHIYNASYLSISWVEENGIMLYKVENGTIKNNIVENSNDDGIHLHFSNHNTIENNIITYSKGYGIYIYHSNNNTVGNNTVKYSNSVNIILYYADDNIIKKNTASNSGTENIYTIYADRNIIRENTLSYGYYQGIWLRFSSNNLILKNVIYNNRGEGLAISSSYPIKVYGNKMTNDSISLYGNVDQLTLCDIPINNTVNDKPVYFFKNADMHNISAPTDVGQIIVANITNFKIINAHIENVDHAISILFSSYIQVYNSKIANASNGVFIEYSNHTILRGNMFKNVSLSIYTYASYSEIFENNTMNGGDEAMMIDWSFNILIKNNTILNQIEVGMWIGWGSNNTTIIGNRIYNSSWYGIFIYFNLNTKIYSNNLTNNSIFIWSDRSSMSTLDISSNNTVNGKPVYFYKDADMNNAYVPTDAGEVILSNITNLNIKNLDIENTGVAIDIFYSSHIHISQSKFSNTFWYGIYAYNLDNSSIENCTVSNSMYNILISSSDYIRISNNTITNSYYYALAIVYSKNNQIDHNIISYSDHGIYLASHADNNLVYNNTIFNNTLYGIEVRGSYNLIYNNSLFYNNGTGDFYNSSHIQACDNGTGNMWNNTKFGNYWNDWANNNDTNDGDNDGIVDWAYPIDGSAGAKDYHPLAQTQAEIPEFSVMVMVAVIVLGFFIITRKRK